MATAVGEILYVHQERQNKAYFSSAEGTDLEFLAIDRYGPDFARPLAQKAVGVVTFSRLTGAAGPIVIPQGTIVSTDTDVNGESQSFITRIPYTLIGLSVDASVEAVSAGVKGNVDPLTINNIDSALLDPTIVVSNALRTAGGKAIETDEEYRETILNLLRSQKGATKAALTAVVKEVAGVEFVNITEEIFTASRINPANNALIGEPFKLVVAKIYIADSSGTASQALVDIVAAQVQLAKALGVMIEILATQAINVDWTASVALNPLGPNYAEFQTNTAKIRQTMIEYIQGLNVGQQFSRIAGRNFVLSVWGPTGTGDITAFTISQPVADITTGPNQKLVPNIVEVI